MTESVHNRQNRRSGGYEKFNIPVNRDPLPGPALSIQCFENRHGECFGTCAPMNIEKCECKCHADAVDSKRKDKKP